MKKITDIRGLLEHELQDLYSAETQIIEALPQMEQAASDAQLKKAFKTHLEQTKKQRDRLEKVAKQMGAETGGHTCKAMQGLVKEGQEVIKMAASDEARDAALIAAAQRVEHYEIAGYGTARHYANMLGESEIADLLAQTLDEEKDTDELLNDLAIQKINKEAQQGASRQKSR
ncbi:MAG: ferritin-like domain-containing protein [Saprospiraceae bacterium]